MIRRMKWAGLEARMGKMKNAYNFFVGKGRDHSKVLGVHGRIILKRILGK
jgi:hypothetical protein